MKGYYSMTKGEHEKNKDICMEQVVKWAFKTDIKKIKPQDCTGYALTA